MKRAMILTMVFGLVLGGLGLVRADDDQPPKKKEKKKEIRLVRVESDSDAGSGQKKKRVRIVRRKGDDTAAAGGGDKPRIRIIRVEGASDGAASGGDSGGQKKEKRIRVIRRKGSDAAASGGKSSGEDIRIRVEKKGDSSGEKKQIRAIIILSDGTKKEIRLNGNDARLYGLSKEDHARIQKLLGARKKTSGQPEKRSKVDKKAFHVEIGKGIIIGPDGKKHEFRFGPGQSLDEALKKLPTGVRVQIEKAQKQAAGGKRKIEKKRSFSFQSIGKGIFIGPNGEKYEFNFGDAPRNKAFDHLPERIREQIKKAMNSAGGGGGNQFRSFGKGIIVGPDGKKREFNFGDGKFQKSDVLGGLPKEIRVEIERAMKKAGATKTFKPKRKTETSQADKLDLILKRLERLEGQIRELRKKVDR